MDLNQPRDVMLIAAAVVVLLLLLMIALAFTTIFSPWLRAKFSGGKVSVVQILGMRLRRTPVNMVLDEYLAYVHSGVDIKLYEIESQYIANKIRIDDQSDLHRHLENYLKAENRL